MTTLADKAILSGADNHPPMLEKDMYDSWKSIMELYMLNRQNGRMILESVESGPLIWPSIVENRVTRPKKKNIRVLVQKHFKLIVLSRQLISILKKFKLLMQGTSLTNQARECNLYEEFDKFADRRREESLPGGQSFCCCGYFKDFIREQVETILENKRTKLLLQLQRERPHVQTAAPYQKQKRDDSWFKDKVLEKVLVITTLRINAGNSKEKDLANNKVTHHPSDPEINTEPITPKLLNKRTRAKPSSFNTVYITLKTDWDMLFQLLFDESLNPPPSVDHPAPEVVALIDEVAAPEPAVSTGSPSSTTVDQ
ncbi:hypothetical protein Tco_0542233, partial [Tanacetum coccineum]